MRIYESMISPWHTTSNYTIDMRDTAQCSEIWEKKITRIFLKKLRCFSLFRWLCASIFVLCAVAAGQYFVGKNSGRISSGINIVSHSFLECISHSWKQQLVFCCAFLLKLASLRVIVLATIMMCSSQKCENLKNVLFLGRYVDIDYVSHPAHCFFEWMWSRQLRKYARNWGTSVGIAEKKCKTIFHWSLKF